MLSEYMPSTYAGVWLCRTRGPRRTGGTPPQPNPELVLAAQGKWGQVRGVPAELDLRGKPRDLRRGRGAGRLQRVAVVAVVVHTGGMAAPEGRGESLNAQHSRDCHTQC